MKKKKLTIDKLVIGAMTNAESAQILGGSAKLTSNILNGCSVTVPPTNPGQSKFLSCA
ncbi:hypothetical protein HDE69_002732 [Pedobacter cryoconitis]|uniref:Uncharacterized protein n=1 Tax=Pedobacter cryoconitis TaxID=188932 RepID=A0A7W9DKC5_9SPHI|nr:hypothetical protein [Pedobacter cryoconitis]MBB5621669.1 hypothetical protein [Pedobacter cryoconitis]